MYFLKLSLISFGFGKGKIYTRFEIQRHSSHSCLVPFLDWLRRFYLRMLIIHSWETQSLHQSPILISLSLVSQSHITTDSWWSEKYQNAPRSLKSPVSRISCIHQTRAAGEKKKKNQEAGNSRLTVSKHSASWSATGRPVTLSSGVWGSVWSAVNENVRGRWGFKHENRDRVARNGITLNREKRKEIKSSGSNSRRLQKAILTRRWAHLPSEVFVHSGRDFCSP